MFQLIEQAPARTEALAARRGNCNALNRATDFPNVEARSSRMSYDAERAAALWQGMKQLAYLMPDEESALLR